MLTTVYLTVRCRRNWRACKGTRVQIRHHPIKERLANGYKNPDTGYILRGKPAGTTIECGRIWFEKVRRGSL